MGTMPVGGIELYINRREGQYLDEMLTMFGLKEINKALTLVSKPATERASSLYVFLNINTMLKGVLRSTHEKGGGIWLTESALQHIVQALAVCDPFEMSAELALEHSQLSMEILKRIAPELTLVEGLVARWEDSPLTTKSKGWD